MGNDSLTTEKKVNALRAIRDSYMVEARSNRDFGRIKAARNRIRLARECNRDLVRSKNT